MAGEKTGGKKLRQEWIYPGMTVLLHASTGGYTDNAGWHPGARPGSGPYASGDPEESGSSDPASFVTYRETLRDHTDDVCREIESLLESLGNMGLDQYSCSLRVAARKHDWGKAHPVMQRTLHNMQSAPYSWRPVELLAKQTRAASAGRHERPYFRHELASALAMLDAGDSHLAVYIVAAHHGRVRMSIRSMPGERDREKRITRGIQEDDVLFACELGGDVRNADTRLTLAAMEVGGPPRKASLPGMTG